MESLILSVPSSKKNFKNAEHDVKNHIFQLLTISLIQGLYVKTASLSHLRFPFN